MTLEEARRLGIESRLESYRAHVRRNLIPAIVATIVATVLFVSTLANPAMWAHGEWLKPGGLLWERFGAEGAIQAVRVLVALPVVLGFAWTGWNLYRLGPGIAAVRRRIAADYRVFDPPERA